MSFFSGLEIGEEEAPDAVISSDSASPAEPDVVALLRSRIKDLEVELAARTDTLTSLEARIRQYGQKTLCPFHSLPNEVLGEIFKFVPRLQRSREDSFAINIHAKATEFPWNVSRVCRRWRMLCTSSANFWNSVSLTGMDRFTSGTSSLLSTVLERTRTGASLDVRLNLSNFSPEYLDLPAMQECLPRITRLDVQGMTREFARLTTVLPLSSLRELTVRFLAVWIPFGDSDDEEDTRPQWDDDPLDCMPILRPFQACPNLHSLSLDVATDEMFAETEPIDHAALTFPWSQLTELAISWPNGGGDLAPLYKSCESLEKLSFTGYAYAPDDPEYWEANTESPGIVAWPTIVLPRLSYLDLQNVPWMMPQSFVCASLDTLCVGSICNELDFVKMVDNCKVEGAVRKLKLVFDRPESLTGARGNVSFEALLPVMQGVEEITIQTLDEDVMDSAVKTIHNLSQWADGGKMLLPCLRAFKLHMSNPYDFREEGCSLTRLILTMLEARMETGLKEATFSLWDSGSMYRDLASFLPEGRADGPGLAESALVKGLDELRAKGLKVSLLVNHEEESEYYL
ncbi:hypothetical protein CYLTODRAFT_490714 [Cylindrobasidium torrendii FP15055 ss-10]|uniref:Uncharacterized protein n=1 Tax=Cylindrobasidium torrendii FP15055 ss-10 TaxID=1314674 RepID=A0A0D7BA24_9AGAR|nr:hypothetical protein CYLTODRAFT_490714 [Cylindrobasidium torrendii FP15055 ss-10]